MHESCEQTNYQGSSDNGFLIVLVLYILLAILLGSSFYY